MRMSFCLAVALILVSAAVATQPVPTLPPGAEVIEARLLARVGPQTRAFIRQEAAQQRGRQTFDDSLVANVRRGYGNLSDTEVEALGFLVMMEAARSAQEDLKAIMASVKSANAKQTTRGTTAERDRLRDSRDSVSELGDQQSLRLQEANARTSKMMQTLSNLSKKMSDTNATITQNLK